MVSISVDELKEKLGPALVVAPFGECIVVPGEKFNPDWEAELGDKGYTCHFTDLDGHAVTLIQLKKAVAEGKVVYVPPKNAEEQVEKVQDIEKVEKEEATSKKKIYVLQGPRWTIAEKTELLKEYDRLVAEGKKYGSRIILAELPQFKGRSKNGIALQLKHLLKKRRVKGEVGVEYSTEINGAGVGFEPTTPVSQVEKVEVPEKKNNAWIAWTPNEDKLLIELRNRQPHLTFAEIFAEFHTVFPDRPRMGTEKRINKLQKKGKFPKNKRTSKNIEAISEPPIEEPPEEIEANFEKYEAELKPEVPDFEVALANLTVETRKQIDDLNESLAMLNADLVENVKTLTEKCVKLQKDLAKHKHAVSGETMLPMEVS